MQGVPAVQLAADGGDGAAEGQAGTGAEGAPLSGALELYLKKLCGYELVYDLFAYRDRLCRLVIKWDIFAGYYY